MKMKKWIAMKIAGCKIHGGFRLADMIVVVMGGKMACGQLSLSKISSPE